MGIVNTSQISDENTSEKRSIDDQNNSPRRSMTPSTPGDKISVKVRILIINLSWYVDLLNEIHLKYVIYFQSEYNGNLVANSVTPDGEKKVGSPLYSFSKIMDRISPEKSPDGGPYTRRGVISFLFMYNSLK